jgi:hypothetical protein
MSLLWQFINTSNISVGNFSQTVMNESTRIGEIAASLTMTQLAALVIGSLSIILLSIRSKSTFPGTPIHGRRWAWEPTLWLQSRFTFGAHEIISSGYKKVRIQITGPMAHLDLGSANRSCASLSSKTALLSFNDTMST